MPISHQQVDVQHVGEKTLPKGHWLGKRPKRKGGILFITEEKMTSELNDVKGQVHVERGAMAPQAKSNVKKP